MTRVNVNVKGSDLVAVVGTIDPDAYTAATYVSDYVDMEKFERVLGIANAGTLGSSGTMTARLVQATDSSGTSKKLLGTAATAVSTSDKVVVLNASASDMDSANSFTFAALEIVIATSTSDAGGVLLGIGAHHGTAADNDHADVAQITGS